MTLAIALLAALHGPPKVSEAALRPLIAREAREHHVPASLLRRLVHRESAGRYWAVGDHGRALGLGQLHVDAIPGVTLTRAERIDVATGMHWTAARLELARKRCHGRPNWASNYSGRPCGVPVYLTDGER